MIRLAAGLFIASLALAVPDSAFAVTRYASPTGSGGVCTGINPCKINVAINGAGAGAEVIVAGDKGPYGSPASPILTAMTTVNTIDVHGASGDPVPVVYSSTPADYALSINNSSTISYIDIEQVNPTGYGLFSGGNLDHVIARGGSTGCQPSGISNQTLTNVLCAGNDYGLFLSSACVCPDSTMTMRNVTTVATNYTGTTFSVNNFDLTVNATNVISRGGGTDVYATAASGFTTDVNFDHSNFATRNEGAGSTITLPGSGTNQEAAPLFVNAGTLDVRQAAGSPTIDAGVNAGANGASDVFGGPRTVHLVTDIGAHEFLPPPEVTTGAASGQTTSGALVAGSVTANSQTTNHHFEYGKTTGYGSSTPEQTLPVSSDAAAVSAALSGLEPGVAYHYRLVASNGSGATNGADATFTTVDPYTGVSFASRNATVKSGAASVKVQCPSGVPGPCAGTLTLNPSGGASNAKKKSKRYGSKKFSIDTGKTKTVKVKLSSKARRSLSRHRKLKASASVTAADGAGLSKSTKKTITLKLSKKHH